MLRVIIGLLTNAFLIPTAVFLTSKGQDGFIYPCLFTVPATLLLALPALLLLRKLNRLDLPAFLLAGMIGGAISFIALIVISRSWDAHLLLAGFMLWVAFGTTHSVIFWAVAVVKNPALRPNHHMSSDGAASGPAGYPER